MTQQLTYYFPTPLPTNPPNCVMHAEPDPAGGPIKEWCTFPTPTLVQSHSTQILPAYMQMTPPQEIAFLTMLPAYCFILAGCAFGLLFIYFTTRLLLLKQKLKEEHVLLSVIPTTQTLQSALATEQLFTQLHALVSQRALSQQLLFTKPTLSMELVATREEGIRYHIHATQSEAAVIKKTLLSYLPGVAITEVSDYLPTTVQNVKTFAKNVSYLASFRLLNHFAHTLQTHTQLAQHDPIAYLTGNMTKLEKGELLTLQLVLAPVDRISNMSKTSEAKKILEHLWLGKDISPLLHDDGLLTYLFFPIKLLGTLCYWVMYSAIEFVSFCFSVFFHADGRESTRSERREPKVFTPSLAQQEQFQNVNQKLTQPLFETCMRLLVIANSQSDATIRIRGFVATLATFDKGASQALGIRQHPLTSFLPRKIKTYLLQFSLWQMSNRLLSFSHTLVLSASELASLYHLPYTTTTKTEGLVKNKSTQLPTPLSLKKTKNTLDVVIGKNTYGGEDVSIGLTVPERNAPTYIVGKTGMGKTTIIKNMAYQDIISGKGLAVIDPHGDMITELLAAIPRHRRNDVIYLDPFDKAFPVGLNILSPGLIFTDPEEEHERITNSVLSIFMKITPKEHWGQRLEHILRNATLTALQLPYPIDDVPYVSLFTIQKLLTDANFRKRASGLLTDPILKQFWEKEYSLYGKMQQASVISPLTNKLGEFITSPLSRRILLQEKSTITMSDVLDEGKILLVNLSKGSLGEERSAFFGTLITSLIQLSAYARYSQPERERRDFFLYIDEFQNFASHHFTDFFSESRKYHVYIIPTHQNIAQIEDPVLAKVVLGNIGSLISLKNGPDDEKTLLPFFEPEVEKGAIVNLPPHHFIMKVLSHDNEDAFSGETVLLNIPGSDETAFEVIELTRKKYATPRYIVEENLSQLFGQNEDKEELTKAKPAKTKAVKKIKKEGKKREKHGM